ncbi:helix-turn-helix domain-containing protein [Parahaliea sp. F7430]|uniref:Helix-turn-helix domain-containing protein n=1 Tax=Sediminihaliea albiluteola TaxID=2758564 RepID=A0A7W2TVK0_9GAMM|nr:helix-turn-helix domain-containing protein [Sediminihaliea albiluteola]MBA6412664.1 helix-turn-helix domain-containing protein [Sediminihaliea albiluteola]
MENKELGVAPDSPGAMLRAAREAQGLSQREVAERLFWLPSYIGIIENNDYAALRSPLLARGYIRAYGRMLEIDTQPLLDAFDSAAEEVSESTEARRKPVAALPAQKVGLAIGLCLAILLVLVFVLWWGRSDADVPAEPAPATLNQQHNSAAGEL